jgi:hypothetical protein
LTREGEDAVHANSKIAVLTCANDEIESYSYLLNLLIDAWQKSGIEIIVLRGVDRFEAADALILHVDLTVVPRDYVALSKRYPVAINGRVHDISKRRISANLLRARDPYQGEVIVKTNRNSGGLPERRKDRRGLWKRVYECLPWSWTGRLAPQRYPIFSSPAAVPRAVWYNPRLVVEKYLPEREGEYYCLRQWIFFGEREVNQRVFSPEPIVKARNVIHREYGLPVPDALRAMRSKLGFDYGKFDYVLVDGEVALLDANRTPFANRDNPSPRLEAIVSELAQGLDGFLTGAGPAAP